MGLTLAPQKGQWVLEMPHSVVSSDAVAIFIASAIGDCANKNSNIIYQDPEIPEIHNYFQNKCFKKDIP